MPAYEKKAPDISILWHDSKQFAEKAATITKEDTSIIGLAVGGSWLHGELDEFSDLDLIW